MCAGLKCSFFTQVTGAVIHPADRFDSSFADDLDDSRSTYGYAVQYGGSPLVWKSRKYKAINLSTTDAEYLAATEVTREVSWIENLFQDLNLDFTNQWSYLVITKMANNIAKGTTVSSRIRHIALRERYVTEKAVSGEIKITWIPTEHEVADMFTKPLPRESLWKHAKTLGMVFREHRCHICLSNWSY